MKANTYHTRTQNSAIQFQLKSSVYEPPSRPSRVHVIAQYLRLAEGKAFHTHMSTRYGLRSCLLAPSQTETQPLFIQSDPQTATACHIQRPQFLSVDTACCVSLARLMVEVLLYVHRNRRFIRDGSPGRPPRLSHSS